MARRFLRRLFGRAKRDAQPPVLRSTVELQALGPLGTDGRGRGPELRAEIAALCDIGCVRETNEDNVRVLCPSEPNELARRGILVVVADGMGGHNAGEVASRLAVEVVVKHYADDGEDPGRSLVKSVEQANNVIVAKAASSARYGGMGTTCTALLLRSGLAYCAHVGDSRLYLVRGNDIFLMTEDHSAVMDLVKQGTITSDEARHHPDKNVIVRALGGRLDVEVANWAQPLSIRPGDTFLICSDGLYDVVEDHELQEALRGAQPQVACERLVELARRRGGPDNISVAVIRMSESAAEKRSAQHSQL